MSVKEPVDPGIPARQASAVESSDQQGVRSVQRALDILALLTEDRPTVSIREIVDSTGLAKTTVLRLVSTLEQSGLLWATTSGYMAGPGLWRWAHLARRSWELPPDTQRRMRELAARRRETVNVYVARDVYRVCIAQQESPQPLRHVVHVGDELPMWAGASAKVLLRDAGTGILDRVARLSPYGPGHVKRLQEWIDEAAVQGYAESHGEREDGLSAVAVPIVGRSGSVVAALALSGPTVRFTEARVSEFAADLRRVAQEMVEQGFSHPFGAGG
ncbi:IclR family transcriptional regulator [Micromonospora sp. NPDC047762]|uniref:IclR family transcriptional regulator n=1 Tax=unclassified Micromonospora TaxID=2617518 RepID=UPI0033D2F578